MLAGHETSVHLELNPSMLRPECKADECIFNWKGVNIPLLSTLNIPIIHTLADIAFHTSLHDTASYGSGL